jgi:hypothetical protein
LKSDIFIPHLTHRPEYVMSPVLMPRSDGPDVKKNMAGWVWSETDNLSLLTRGLIAPEPFLGVGKFYLGIATIGDGDVPRVKHHSA